MAAELSKRKKILLMLLGGVFGVIFAIFAVEVARQVFGVSYRGARSVGAFGLLFVIWFAYIALSYPSRSALVKKLHIAAIATLVVVMFATWDFEKEKFVLSTFAGDPIKTLGKNKNCRGAGYLDQLVLIGDKLVAQNGVALAALKAIDASTLEMRWFSTNNVIMLNVEWESNAMILSSPLPSVGWKVCDR
jgi:hypothetical protein